MFFRAQNKLLVVNIACVCVCLCASTAVRCACWLRERLRLLLCCSYGESFTIIDTAAQSKQGQAAAFTLLL